MRLSNRASSLAPSPTLAITAKANALRKQGVNVVGFGAGEPDFNTPEHVLQAAHEAMQKGYTKYTPAGGIVELKEAIREKLERENGLRYQINQVVVSSGAKHALYNLFQVLLNPGEEVIIPIPYWVSYPEQVKLAGGVPVFLDGEESNQFKITPTQLEAAITPKTRIFVLNSPSNPTGTVYTEEELRKLADVCIQHGLIVFSDEIYEKLLYDGSKHTSIASLGEEIFAQTIVINGVSKPYSMTGWRIGYAAGPSHVMKAAEDLSSQSTSNPTSIAQYAALAAITGTQEPLQEMIKHFTERRRVLMQLIAETEGLSCVPPKGAFYAYVNIADSLQAKGLRDADQWAGELLEQQQVAVVPGTGFGTNSHVRISYATSLQQIEEGMARIKSFVQA